MRKGGDLLYLLLEQFSVWNGQFWLYVLELDFEVSELVKITAFSIDRMFLMVCIFPLCRIFLLIVKQTKKLT